MLAVARFTAASCLHAQRWLAPTIAYAVAVAGMFAAGGDARANLSVSAAVLFPVAAWLTVVVLNDEDDDHAIVTAAIAGGMRRLRLAKLGLAAAAGIALAAGGVIIASERAATPLASFDFAAGCLAAVAAVLGGVGVGALCARPYVKRSGSALSVILATTLVVLLVPDAPLHLVLSGLGGHALRWGTLAAGSACALAGGTALAAISLARSR
jgi:hypothetical protein